MIFLHAFLMLYYSLNIRRSLECAIVWIPMMAADGGGFDRIRVAPGLPGVMNVFGHARANAAGCTVVSN